MSGNITVAGPGVRLASETPMLTDTLVRGVMERLSYEFCRRVPGDGQLPPIEAYRIGLISYAEFWRIVSPYASEFEGRVSVPRPSHPEPPRYTDLIEHGPQECLAALREEWLNVHGRSGIHARMVRTMRLGMAVRRVLGAGAYPMVERGDILLVRPSEPSSSMFGEALSSAYCPRVGHLCALPADAIIVNSPLEG